MAIDWRAGWSDCCTMTSKDQRDSVSWYSESDNTGNDLPLMYSTCDGQCDPLLMCTECPTPAATNHPIDSSTPTHGPRAFETTKSCLSLPASLRHSQHTTITATIPRTIVVRVLCLALAEVRDTQHFTCSISHATLTERSEKTVADV